MERFLLWIGDGVIRLLDFCCDYLGCSDHYEALVVMLLFAMILMFGFAAVLMDIPKRSRSGVRFFATGIKAIILALAWSRCKENYHPLGRDSLAKAYQLLERRYEAKQLRRLRRQRRRRATI